MQGADPVAIGLVDSLNRPGGNLTGIGLLAAETAAKCFELLLEVVPKAKSIAYLRNPTNPAFAESETRELQTAARAHGVELLPLNASEIDTAFDDLVRQRADALQVSSDGFLVTHPEQIVAAVGGLMSYGTNIRDAWRQAGIYTGRILNGEKPADLPVQEVTKIELVINLKTAKTLGLTVPLSLLGRADQVIE
jgi:putative ABC transport system substrate-binding protein